MGNTEQTKTFLQKAISSISNDFALREVRYHLQQAAKKLEHVEKHRIAKEPKKLTQHQKWQERLSGGIQNPYTGQHTFDIINDMIEGEQAKLKDIFKKKNVPSEEDEDTLLG